MGGKEGGESYASHSSTCFPSSNLVRAVELLMIVIGTATEENSCRFSVLTYYFLFRSLFLSVSHWFSSFSECCSFFSFVSISLFWSWTIANCSKKAIPNKNNDMNTEPATINANRKIKFPLFINKKCVSLSS